MRKAILVHVTCWDLILWFLLPTGGLQKQVFGFCFFKERLQKNKSKTKIFGSQNLFWIFRARPKNSCLSCEFAWGSKSGFKVKPFPQCQTLTVSLRTTPDLLKLVTAEMKYSCCTALFFFPLPNQHDQVFLKLNRMTYWLARIIHARASIKKERKRSCWEGVGWGYFVLWKMPQGSCR